jgi:hypothetical protein
MSSLNGSFSLDSPPSSLHAMSPSGLGGTMSVAEPQSLVGRHHSASRTNSIVTGPLVAETSSVHVASRAENSIHIFEIIQSLLGTDDDSVTRCEIRDPLTGLPSAAAAATQSGLCGSKSLLGLISLVQQPHDTRAQIRKYLRDAEKSACIMIRIGKADTSGL